MTNNTCFMQAKAVHREKKEDIVERFFVVNCLKAYIDKVKQPNCGTSEKTRKKWVLPPSRNRQLKVSLFCLCTSKF